jgi:hypothetical protein
MYLSSEAVPAHWNPLSQPYAGGDNLLAALNAGWTVRDTVKIEVHKLRSSRVTVYHFELHNDTQILQMPIIANPFIEQFIARRRLITEPYSLSTYPTAPQRFVA